MQSTDCTNYVNPKDKAKGPEGDMVILTAIVIIVSKWTFVNTGPSYEVEL